MASDGVTLRATGIGVTFGGVHAVDDLSIEVAPGRLVGLIGPNGAGKTTTIDALCGFVPHRGRVHLGDRDLTGQAPHRRAAAGLARTWQSLELFDDLTVLENCQLAAAPATVANAGRDAGRAGAPGLDAAWEALDVFGLTEVAHLSPTALSLGRRKLVAVARSLAAQPRILLLDEPAAGLDSDESIALGETLRGLLHDGLGMLLVDHDMALVLGACDEVHVLDFGRVIAHGPPEQVRSDPRVVEAYLGTHAESAT